MTIDSVVKIETVYGVVSLSERAAAVMESYNIKNRTAAELARAFALDVTGVRAGWQSIKELRGECLCDAEPEHAAGWNDYVDAVEVVADRTDLYPRAADAS